MQTVLCSLAPAFSLPSFSWRVPGHQRREIKKDQGFVFVFKLMGKPRHKQAKGERTSFPGFLKEGGEGLRLLFPGGAVLGFASKRRRERRALVWALSSAILGSWTNNSNCPGSLFPYLYKGNGVHFLCLIVLRGSETIVHCEFIPPVRHLSSPPSKSALELSTFRKPSLVHHAACFQPPCLSSAFRCWLYTDHECTALSCALSLVFRSSVLFVFLSGHEERGSFPLSHQAHP